MEENIENSRPLAKRPRRDTLGKSALYWFGEPGEDDEEAERASLMAERYGKRALFSNPDAPLKKADEKKAIELTCSSCKKVSYVDPVEFIKDSLPVIIWLPWREYGNYMLCPNCKKRTWVKSRITLLVNLGL